MTVSLWLIRDTRQDRLTWDDREHIPSAINTIIVGVAPWRSSGMKGVLMSKVVFTIVLMGGTLIVLVWAIKNAIDHSF